MAADMLCDDFNCVSTIFFDLDNTLIQTRKADKKACNKVVNILTEQYGLSEGEALESASTYLREFRKCPDNEKYDLDLWRQHLWSAALPEEYADIADEVFVQWLELRYHYLQLSRDVIHLLKSLREHYWLGLITNGPSRAQWEKMERLHLREYFHCILVSGDLPYEKPDQQIFHQACRQLKVQPRQCIMVGDKLETDIQGGIEAELGGTVWIPLTSEAEHREKQVSPDYTIHNVTELPELLPNPPPGSPKHVRNNSRDSAIVKS